MPKVMKKCRVCGKSYEACRTLDTRVGVFRWQDVACSPECGSVYLEQILTSRNKAQVASPEKEVVEEVVPEATTIQEDVELPDEQSDDFEPEVESIAE